jgi:Poly(3-hydroxybutyrate) depolymerase
MYIDGQTSAGLCAGTEDRVCPYEGDGPCWFDPHREEIAQRWARHNRCAGEWAEEQVSELAFKYSWPAGECDLAETVFYKLEDFGHSWPGALGESRSGIDASELMWQFFFSGSGLGSRGGHGGGEVGRNTTVLPALVK